MEHICIRLEVLNRTFGFCKVLIEPSVGAAFLNGRARLHACLKCWCTGLAFLSHGRCAVSWHNSSFCPAPPASFLWCLRKKRVWGAFIFSPVKCRKGFLHLWSEVVVKCISKIHSKCLSFVCLPLYLLAMTITPFCFSGSLRCPLYALAGNGACFPPQSKDKES